MAYDRGEDSHSPDRAPGPTMRPAPPVRFAGHTEGPTGMNAEYLKGLAQGLAWLVTSGALGWLGAYILKMLKRRDERLAAQAARDKDDNRTTIGDYRQMMDEQEAAFLRARGLWAEEREGYRKEIADYKLREEVTGRSLQHYLVEAESMRGVIITLRRDVLLLSGGIENFIASDRFDPVIFADIDGNICYANEAASLYTGYAKEDLLLMNTDQLVPPSLIDAHRAGMARMRNGGWIPRGAVREANVENGRLLNADGTEIPTEISVTTFTVGTPPNAVMGCRSQMRRRFQRDRSPVTRIIPVRRPSSPPSIDPTNLPEPTAAPSPIVASNPGLIGPVPPAPIPLQSPDPPPEGGV